MKPIDLGVVPEWKKNAAVQAPATPVFDDKPDYPDVFIEGVKGLELPDSGEITFEFEVVREVSEKKEGVEKCSYNLKLKRIVDVESDECCDDSADIETADEAMDKHLRPMKE